jgi:hypothetical protein
MVDGPSDLDQLWWHDGALWWPCESADGRQRFTGGRWVPKRRGFGVLKVLSCLWIALSPIALLVSYAGTAENPDPDAVIFAYVGLLWAPVGLVGLLVALWFLGRPGLGRRGRVRWAWTPPPGWPTPPSGWVPPAGWKPDPSWPSPPAQWRGWQRQRTTGLLGSHFVPVDPASQDQQHRNR